MKLRMDTIIHQNYTQIELYRRKTAKDYKVEMSTSLHLNNALTCKVRFKKNKGQKNLVTSSQNEQSFLSSPLYSLRVLDQHASHVSSPDLSCFVSSALNICEMKCPYWTSLLIRATHKSLKSHANFPPTLSRKTGKQSRNKTKKKKEK